MSKRTQWRIGGGPADVHHTRILDIAWSEQAEVTQQQILANYTPAAEAVDSLAPELFPQLLMLRP